eukprot:3688513-Prymnesium_polylepis.1
MRTSKVWNVAIHQNFQRRQDAGASPVHLLGSWSSARELQSFEKNTRLPVARPLSRVGIKARHPRVPSASYEASDRATEAP